MLFLLYKYKIIEKEGVIMKHRTGPNGVVFRNGETYLYKKKLYRYTFTDSFGHRQSIYAKDLKVLREKEEEIRKDISDCLDTYVRGKATINYVFDRYIKLRNELKSTTIWNYTYTYDRYVRDGFGHRKIADVKYSDIRVFYNDLIKKGYSISTVDNVNSVIHPTFEMAVRDDIIRKNPSDNVLGEVKKIHRANNKRRALTVEQENAFLNFLERPENLTWKPIFTTMFATGLRVGELISLTWDNVDFDKGRITVTNNITYCPRVESGGKSEYKLTATKTEAGDRTIPLRYHGVYDVLSAYKSYQEESGNCCNSVIDGVSGFVFYNRFNTICNPASINREIKRLVAKYNAEEEVNAAKEKRRAVIIPDFSCHIARHTFCTRLCENDTNIKVIQDVMGHKDIQTTLNIYAEVSEKKKQDELARM